MTDAASFMDAIRAGAAANVCNLLSETPALARARQNGVSAVLFARYCGRHEIVALLRTHLSELDLFEAAALGDEARLAALLKADPESANAVAEDGFGPLGLASFFDHESCVRLLLGCGARVDVPSANTMRVMPLHSAAAARSVPIARLLLDHGGPVNARQGQGSLGFTPLMEAALNGQAAMVTLLLDHGADRSLRDDAGLTAADHATKGGHEEVAELCR